VGEVNTQIAFRRNAADAHIVHEMLVGKWYERFMPDTSPDVIFDLGANIGMSAVYMRTLYPQARIFAFEPDPVNARVLRANEASIVPGALFECGVWSENTDMKFYRSKHFETRNSVYLDEKDRIEISVPLISFESASERAGVNKVDFVKFDIEGAEIEFFSTADLSRIGGFLGELHPTLRGEEAIVQLIERLKQTHDVVVERGNPHVWHIVGRLRGTTQTSRALREGGVV
jgi:FkbM family methyltransferase